MKFQQRWYWRLVTFVPTTSCHSALCAFLVIEQNMCAVQGHTTNLIRFLTLHLPIGEYTFLANTLQIQEVLYKYLCLNDK